MPKVAVASLDIQLECYGKVETMLKTYQSDVEQSKIAAKSWCSGEFPPGWPREINGQEIQLPSDTEAFFKDSCASVQNILLQQLKTLNEVREVCDSDSWGRRTVVSAVGEVAVTETTNCVTPEISANRTWSFERESAGPWSHVWVFKSPDEWTAADGSTGLAGYSEMNILDDSKGTVHLDGAVGGYRLMTSSSQSPNEYIEMECEELK